MWLFTRDGFFSVTQNTRSDQPDTLMVRARVREDLENLRTVIDAQDTQAPPIIESKRADYRYRMIIPRLWWVAYVAQAAQEIDYTNVKDTLAPMKTEPARHRAMLKCWSAMYALQPGARRWETIEEWDALPDDDDWEWEEEV